ncbi:MAG: glycosyltransferase [Intestinimonas sp.]|jgi:GT2 family glycosyltransferase/SAM-dependent methyltransferase|nr:glycosyltransferase [Intestinimonas sp.]
MKFTGERFIPGQTDVELEIEHMNRYQFACQFVTGKRVLDAACGAGYGSALLAKAAKFVDGIDLSDETIAYAQENYGGPNTCFQTASVAKLPFEDGSFDVVVSFETLEHVDEAVQLAFLREIQRVLTLEGVLVMSTPNHLVYAKRGPNTFHVKELEYGEFRDLLGLAFPFVRMFSQETEVCDAIVDGETGCAEAEGGSTGENAEYLIAVCARQDLGSISTRVIVRSDHRYEQLLKWAVETDQMNTRNNAHVAKLDLQISELGIQITEQQHTLETKEEQLTQLLQSESNLAAEVRCKEDTIAQQGTALAEKEQTIAQQGTALAEKEQTIAQQGTALAEKEQTIAQQGTALAEKEQTIAQQGTALAEKEQTIAQQGTALVEKEQLLRNKEGHIELLLESDRELERIKSSRSWRFMGYVWKLRDALIPKGSKRRLLGKMAVKFVKHPLHFLSKCTPHKVSKFFRTLRREGVEGTSRRLDDCLIGSALPPQKLTIDDVSETTPEALVKTVADYTPLHVPQWDKPTVSIVIPVYNQFDYTYACVKSILQNSGDMTYEILIADDCSTDVTRDIDAIITGLHTIHNAENLRFLRNCNHAAKEAHGTYILFLNNDTQVQENWLAPLVKLMEQDKTIGMTGSKLVYPDGRLQEAGGIFWNDASAWNYGNRADPAAPEYNYVKDVDYISGASICICKALWEEIGGFDDRFAPAYCEDSDLAFEVRAHGKRVVYQPLSVVVHFEGVSNGTDTSTGQKRYQVINQKKFYEKWKDVLEREHFPNGENAFQARDRSRNKMTVLMIDHYVPMYDKDAGSRTVFQYLRLLSSMGYCVKFIGDNFYPHQPYTQELQQMGVEVLCGPYYASHWKDWLKENGDKLSVVFSNRPHITEKYIEFVKKSTNARVIYNLSDLHFLREHREYEVTGDSALLKSSEEWKRKEFHMIELADTVYTLSTVEQGIVDQYFQPPKTELCPIFIYDDFVEQLLPREKTQDLIFVGGFNHHPNGDAVEWFCSEVFPKILQELPEVRLHVVGSNPSEKIQQLASDHVLIEGFVTDEALDEFYGACRVCVIPLRYGAGVKGKTIEAMYHGIPIVTTSTGIEGLPGIADCLPATDTAEEFAARTVSIYRGDVEDTTNKCYEYVRKHYSRKAAEAFFARTFRPKEEQK